MRPLAPDPADRQHHITCSPCWNASPLCPCLSFWYTQPLFVLGPQIRAKPLSALACPVAAYPDKTRTMYTIAKRFAFSASHTIGGVPPDHPCGRLHGHNYEVEVILQSASLDAVGFVRDYGELSALKEFLDTTVD